MEKNLLPYNENESNYNSNNEATPRNEINSSKIPSNEEYKPGPPLLFVKFLDERIITLDFFSYYTIYQVNMQLQEKTGISIKTIRLIFAGKQLEDDRTLSDYCAQQDSTFHAVLRVKSAEQALANIPLNWKPSNPEFLTVKESNLHRKFREAISNKNNPDFSSLILEESKFVYSFDFLDEAYYLLIEDEIFNFLSVTRNSGIALRADKFKFQEAVNLMWSTYAELIVRYLYPKLNSEFKIHSKLMTYRLTTNEDWPKHVDGDVLSIITNFSKNFEGTDLRLYNYKDKDNNNTQCDFVDYKDQIGRAIILPGNIKHAVTPLTKGQRLSLVIKVNRNENNERSNIMNVNDRNNYDYSFK